MIYSFGEQILSEVLQSTEFLIEKPISYFNWKVEFVTGNSYFLGSDNCPIIEGDFSRGIYGMGNASLKFAFFDNVIESQERVRIYYKGVKKYEGYINGEPDKSGGKISISPNKDKMLNALYNNDFTSTFVTYLELIENILNSLSEQTGILYNETYLSITSTETISPNYNYAKANTVLKEIEEQQDNRFSGYDEDNFYYVRPYSTEIDYYIYYNDFPPFSGIQSKIDDKKIKLTRAQVFQKSTILNENIRIGEIGYNSTSDFPPLNIEQFVGIKEGKITVPGGLNTTQALDYAYKQIISKTDRPINLKTKNFDLNYNPDLREGQLVRIYDSSKLQWRTILNCESTAGWSGGELSTDSRFDTYSLLFGGSSNTIYYSYNRLQKWYKLYKIGFWLKSDIIGSYINFSISNQIGGYSKGHYSIDNYSIGENTKSVSQFDTDYTFNINVGIPNTWRFYSFPVDIDDFRYIFFRTNNTEAIVKIDNISLFQYYQNFNDANIIEFDYTLGSDLIDITLGKFDENLDDEFFQLKNKVEKLEETLQEI
jgi:hypothetical protein